MVRARIGNPQIPGGDGRPPPRLRAFEDAKRGATRHAIAQAGMELLDVLPPGTHPELQVEVAATTAAALLEDDGADYDQNVESAIALGELAISILNSHPDLDHPHSHVPILMNLGTAFGLRPRGDPAWNRTQSITYLTNAIDLSWQAGNRDSWAMGLTNLALRKLRQSINPAGAQA